eukprot:TRINITY_DN19060_c0_g1_i2.p1 TRINITY_DN19060_c0_g1~~TRINITY_DN19060_c0_g1_i2.p1  ORF type:complete len:272 (+),score=31.29 TRINITY_DN19060_c0_g1_i2:104-817(+)
MGQEHSQNGTQQPVYAEDGETVIGMTMPSLAVEWHEDDIDSIVRSVGGPCRNQPESAPISYKPVEQRWFDGPGRAWAPGAMGHQYSGQDAAVAVPTILTVRNRTGWRVLAACGGPATRVDPGRSGQLKARSSVVLFRDEEGRLLAELQGVPTSCETYQAISINLKEVGGVVAASLEYSMKPAKREDVRQPRRNGNEEEQAGNDAPARSEDTARWEARLADAVARGDDAAAREALSHL